MGHGRALGSRPSPASEMPATDILIASCRLPSYPRGASVCSRRMAHATDEHAGEVETVREAADLGDAFDAVLGEAQSLCGEGDATFKHVLRWSLADLEPEEACKMALRKAALLGKQVIGHGLAKVLVDEMQGLSHRIVAMGKVNQVRRTFRPQAGHQPRQATEQDCLHLAGRGHIAGAITASQKLTQRLAVPFQALVRRQRHWPWEAAAHHGPREADQIEVGVEVLDRLRIATAPADPGGDEVNASGNERIDLAASHHSARAMVRIDIKSPVGAAHLFRVPAMIDQDIGGNIEADMQMVDFTKRLLDMLHADKIAEKDISTAPFDMSSTVTCV